MSSSSVSGSSVGSSIPEQLPLPGCSSEQPIFRHFGGEIQVMFSNDIAINALREACGSNAAAFFRLKALIPLKFSHDTRIALYSSIATSVAALVSASGLLALTDTTLAFGGNEVIMTCAIAAILIRFMYLRLASFMDSAHLAAVHLHSEFCRKISSFCKGIEHNMLRYSSVTRSLILQKTLFNRSATDRANCLDNVISETFRVGDRVFATAEETTTSSKLNFYSFKDVLAYFGDDAFISYERIGGVAQMPLWRLRLHNDDEAFKDAYYHCYGRFPTPITVPDTKFVFARLLDMRTLTYRGEDFPVALVLLRDRAIAGLTAAKVYITEDLVCMACFAIVPATMLWYPLVPVSIRQSYKKERASNNIIMQSRPTLFRDNDGRIGDGDQTYVRRAWQGRVTSDANESVRIPAGNRRRGARRRSHSAVVRNRAPRAFTCRECGMFVCICEDSQC